MKNIVISFLLTGSCAVSAMQSGVPPIIPVAEKFTKNDPVAIAAIQRVKEKTVNEDVAYLLQLRLPHQSRASSSFPSSSPQQSSPWSWRNSANWHDEKSLDK